MGAAYLKGPQITAAAERNPGCTGKVQYESRPEANIAIKTMRASRTKPYACPYCGKWHVGRGLLGVPKGQETPCPVFSRR